MKKILMAFVAVAILIGFAMADVVDVSKMTAEEKYNYARTLDYRTPEAKAIYEEIKDSEELTAHRRSVCYRLADPQSVEYARIGAGLADETNNIRGQHLSILVRKTEGEEQEGYINEMVRLAGQWVFPYEARVIPLLVQRDRIDDAKAVAKAVLESPRVGVSHINRAMLAFELEEALDILIGNFPNVRDSKYFIPKQDEDGKLVGDSIVTLAIDMVESNYDKLTYAERTDFRRRIDGQLGMTDPVHRILKEALRSAQEADAKAEEMFK